MTKINDKDNIVTDENIDVIKSQTLSNPKITDMNEASLDQVESDINPEIRDGFKDEENLSTEGRKSGFLSGLKVGFIDTVIMVVVSGLLLCVTGVILLYGAGYYITNALGVLFVILVIVSVLYPAFKSSYESKKLNKTNKI